MVTRPAWATSSGIMDDGTVRHFSDPAPIGERHATLLQDDGGTPFLLVTLVPHSTVVAELTLEEAAAVGIDVAALWGVQ